MLSVLTFLTLMRVEDKIISHEHGYFMGEIKAHFMMQLTKPIIWRRKPIPFNLQFKLQNKLKLFPRPGFKTDLNCEMNTYCITSRSN